MYEDGLREIAEQIRVWLEWPDGTSMAAILRREQLEEWVNTLESAAGYIENVGYDDET